MSDKRNESWSNMKVEKTFGASSGSKACFSQVDDTVAYAVSGGVVVTTVINMEDGNIRYESNQQRFFCASSRGQNNKLIYQPSPRDSFGLLKPDQSILLKTDASFNEDELDKCQTQLKSDLKPTQMNSSRIKKKTNNISCLSLSPDKKYLIVGETGHQPRILVYSLAPDSNEFPIFAIYQHSFGLANLKFNSKDSTIFSSLGLPNDGFLHIWKLQSNTVHILGSNKNTSIVYDVIWLNQSLITYGVRHLKVWTPILDDKPPREETGVSRSNKTVKGNNVVLGELISATFTNAACLDNKLLLLADTNQIVVYEPGRQLTYFNLSEYGYYGVDHIVLCEERHKLWATQGEVILDLDLSDVLEKQRAIKTVKGNGYLSSDNSPSKKSPQHITTLTETVSVDSENAFATLTSLSNSHLLYFARNGEIGVLAEDHSKTCIISPMLSKINGFKRCSSGQIFMWSENGQCKMLNEQSLELEIFKIVPRVDTSMGYFENCQVTAMDHFFGVNGRASTAIGNKDGYLFIYEGFEDDLYPIFQTRAHTSIVNDLTYLKVMGPESSAEVILTISRDSTIQAFVNPGGVEGWRLSETIVENRGNVSFMQKLNNLVYVAFSDRSIIVYGFKLTNGELLISKVKSIALKSSPVAMFVASSFLFVTTSDKHLAVFDLLKDYEILRIMRVFDEQSDAILVDKLCIIYDSSGPTEIICSSSFDKTLRCYSYPSGKLLKEYVGQSATIIGLCILDSQKLLSASINGCVFIMSPRVDDTVHYSTESDLNEKSSPQHKSKLPAIVTRKIKKAERASMTAKLSPSTPKSRAHISPVRFQPVSPLSPVASRSSCSSPLYSRRASESQKTGQIAGTQPETTNQVMASLERQLRDFRIHIFSSTSKDVQAYKELTKEIKLLYRMIEPYDHLLERYSEELLNLVQTKLEEDKI